MRSKKPRQKQKLINRPFTDERRFPESEPPSAFPRGISSEVRPALVWTDIPTLDSMGRRCLFAVRVILMSVKEACDPFLQLSGVTRLTHRNRVVKEVPLNLRRQIIPLHDHCGAQASQDMLLLLRQGGTRLAVVLRLRLWSSTFAFPSGKGSGQLGALLRLLPIMNAI
jgi:hypothetical protein